MSINIIAVFDLGKTQKKLLLFDSDFKYTEYTSENFSYLLDEDQFPTENIKALESWIDDNINHLLASGYYNLTGINFATYGASLICLDEDGKRIAPLYNYLKTIPKDVDRELYEKYNRAESFDRVTASPSLGFLNAGKQILWLKKYKPRVYNKIKHILFFPQYFSFLYTGNIISELTSIGCHTNLWDYDKKDFHQWVKDYKIPLAPLSSTRSYSTITYKKHKIKAGKGIHDSSAAILPFETLMNEPFILISTGTWNISMNPFDRIPLTQEELNQDCLTYLTAYGRPVKASRFFMGHIHDQILSQLADYFHINPDELKNIYPDKMLFEKILFNDKNIFFPNGVTYELENVSVLDNFNSAKEAYYQLMKELTYEYSKKLNLMLRNTDVNTLVITGGFQNNLLFLNFLHKLYPQKKITLSKIKHATALGAAIITEIFNNKILHHNSSNFIEKFEPLKTEKTYG